jgi:hypothetical protein
MTTRAILAIFVLGFLMSCTPPQEAASAVEAGLFVDVRIPEPLKPLERGRKYESPLHEALTSRHLGEITGGGSQIGQEKPDGTQDIEFVALDVNLNDLDGLPVLRTELKRLGAPKGTTLHYELDGKSVTEPLWQ